MSTNQKFENGHLDEHNLNNKTSDTMKKVLLNIVIDTKIKPSHKI